MTAIRALPARMRLEVRRPMILVQLVAIVILGVTWYRVALDRWENDAYSYWIAWQGGLYDIPWLVHGAYNYSPAFAQAIYPWTLISWKFAWALESAAQIAALAVIAGPLLAVVLYYMPLNIVAGYPNPVAATIGNGNIEILVALAVVAAYRWPGAWALVLHTKITPGVGMLWYAVRLEWRNLAIAIGVAAVIAAVSFVVAPDLWFQWLGLLRAAGGADTVSLEPIVPLPLAIRLVLAVIIVVWGARTNRYWTVPIAATLGLPAIRLGGLAVLVGVVPFVLARSRLAFLIPRPILDLWGLRSEARPRPEASLRPEPGLSG